MRTRSSFQSNSSFFLNVFSGREHELMLLDKNLNESAGYPVLLIGPGGIGKTSLVFAYTNRYASRYRTINRFSCGSSRDFVGLASEISTLLSTIPKTQQPAKGHLLIVDDFDAFNFKSQNVAFDFLRNVSRRISVLIIVRSEALTNERRDIFKYPRIVLGPLSNKDITDLIKKRFKLAGINDFSSFSQSLVSEGLDFDKISPRFAHELLQSYIRNKNFDFAYNEVARGYFSEINEFVISSSEDKFKIVPVSDENYYNVKGADGQIITGTSSFVIPNYRNLWRNKISELEEMINDSKVKEKDIQNFFENNPKLLCGLDYRNIIAHPVLERDDDGDLIPDFFLTPINGNFADILDLKKPDIKLFAGRKDRKRLSQSICDVLAQLRVYRDYFENPVNLNRVKQKYGITAYKPNVVAVIGRSDAEISEVSQRQILDDLPRYAEIVTYDDLLAKMRRIETLNLY